MAPCRSPHHLDNVHNLRDIASAAPARMRAGRVYRAATLCWATPADCDYITDDLKVRTIIDFRTPAEAATDSGPALLRRQFLGHAFPDFQAERREENDRWLLYNPYSNGVPRFLVTSLAWWQILVLIVLHVVGKLYSPAAAAGRRMVIEKLDQIGLEGLYAYFVEYAGKEINQSLQVLASDAHLPALVHCYHGKDRTGITGLQRAVCVVFVVYPCTHTKGLAPPSPWGCKGVYSYAISSTAVGVYCGRPCCDVLCAAAEMLSHVSHTVALVLALLGVGRDAIARDYALSAEFGMSPRGQTHIKHHKWLTPEKWGSAPPAAILSALDLVDRKYGGIEKYLSGIGFDATWQAKLKATLLK